MGTPHGAVGVLTILRVPPPTLPTMHLSPSILSPPPNGKLMHRWNKPQKTRKALHEAFLASGELSPICHQYQGWLLIMLMIKTVNKTAFLY